MPYAMFFLTLSISSFKGFHKTLLLSILCLWGAAVCAAESLTPQYMNPDADLSQYDRILLNRLNMDNARIIPPPWVEGADRYSGKWAMDKNRVKTMQQIFSTQLKQQLEIDGAYVLTEDADEGVLEISIKVISLTPYASHDENVISKGSGELNMQVTLRDAHSGSLLAIFDGEQKVGEHYHKRSDISAMEDVKALFTQWGERIRHVLDLAHGKASFLMPP